MIVYRVELFCFKWDGGSAEYHFGTKKEAVDKALLMWGASFGPKGADWNTTNSVELWKLDVDTSKQGIVFLLEGLGPKGSELLRVWNNDHKRGVAGATWKRKREEQENLRRQRAGLPPLKETA